MLNVELLSLLLGVLGATAELGAEEGEIVGLTGDFVGIEDGFDEGVTVGLDAGRLVVGFKVGLPLLGARLGNFVVGFTDGKRVGDLLDGDEVGRTEEGLILGNRVGTVEDGRKDTKFGALEVGIRVGTILEGATE